MTKTNYTPIASTAIRLSPAKLEVQEVRILKSSICNQILEFEIENTGERTGFINRIDIHNGGHWVFDSGELSFGAPIHHEADIFIDPTVGSLCSVDVKLEIGPLEKQRLQLNLSVKYGYNPKVLSLFLLYCNIYHDNNIPCEGIPLILTNIQPRFDISESSVHGYDRWIAAKNKKLAKDALQLPIEHILVRDETLSTLRFWEGVQPDDEYHGLL